MGEIIRSIQGPMSAIDCAEVGTDGHVGMGALSRCAPAACSCPVWDKAHRAMMDVFDGTTFGDLVEQERAAERSAML